VILSEKFDSALPSNLAELAACHATQFQQTEPFSYVVLDNFLPEPVARWLAAQCQNIPEASWKRDFVAGIKDFDSVDLDRMNQELQHVMAQFTTSPILKFMEQLTGLPALLPDPYLIAGIMSFRPGGYEEIHIDANIHGLLKLYRRIGMVIFMTPDWLDEYNGHFEMWNSDMTELVRRVPARFNRCIIYNYFGAFHGYPATVGCPPGMRQTILSIVYSSAEPGKEDDLFDRGILWQSRPNPARPIPTQVNYANLSKTQLLAMLSGTEKVLQKANQDYNSRILGLRESLENQHRLHKTGQEFLDTRVESNFQQAQILQQQKEQLEAALLAQRKADKAERRRLLLELGAARQWARELEQRLKSF
jgi:hypothetical protein